jgi:hypothetical protein
MVNNIYLIILILDNLITETRNNYSNLIKNMDSQSDKVKVITQVHRKVESSNKIKENYKKIVKEKNYSKSIDTTVPKNRIPTGNNIVLNTNDTNKIKINTYKVGKR